MCLDVCLSGLIPCCHGSSLSNHTMRSMPAPLRDALKISKDKHKERSLEEVLQEVSVAGLGGRETGNANPLFPSLSCTDEVCAFLVCMLYGSFLFSFVNFEVSHKKSTESLVNIQTSNSIALC